MRIGYGVLCAALLAAPAMAADLTIQPPNPGAAAEAQHNAYQSDRDARHDFHAARRDEHRADRDAAMGNYRGAAREDMRAHEAAGDARHDLHQADRDANQARRDQSWQIGH